MKSLNLSLGAAIAASTIFCGVLGSAHQIWGDGSPVSEKVKQLCCGDAEAHFLPPGSVHALADGWHIDRFPTPVPYGKELPSPDGHDWGFWAERQYPDFEVVAGQPEMQCLFLTPRSG